MKISIVGHFGDSLDEGVRNVAKIIANELEGRGIEVKKTDISSLSSFGNIYRYKPDIVHFIMSSTTKGIITAKLFSASHIRAKTVISAIQPAVLNWKLVGIFKPDLMLVQSKDSDLLFKSLGFKTEFLPNGVNINRFTPVNSNTKQRLRGKYKVPKDKFIILHLASMTRERNLDIFKEIQKQEGIQILIIGRENENGDEKLIEELKKAGCEVWIKHFSNIEEIYHLSDCYLFPTVEEKACIETPLSVLEAMACNLPVITTKFRALPNIFENKDGLFFIEDKVEILSAIKIIKENNLEIRTREMVLPFSWENVSDRLERIYNKMVDQ